ncbi:hypothetical protein LY76DRAFT_58434 [Colletotrichum caudatum]|nr:hypothetical protein LY76DRAFT_58434 [Colletotrichum caudatum]
MQDFVFFQTRHVPSSSPSSSPFSRRPWKPCLSLPPPTQRVFFGLISCVFLRVKGFGFFLFELR